MEFVTVAGIIVNAVEVSVMDVGLMQIHGVESFLSLTISSDVTVYAIMTEQCITKSLLHNSLYTLRLPRRVHDYRHRRNELLQSHPRRPVLEILTVYVGHSMLRLLPPKPPAPHPRVPNLHEKRLKILVLMH